jgi:hypothetical protein
MPGGLQCRSPECRLEIAIILLTGFAADATEMAMSSQTSGRFSLFHKPVSVEQLSERIEMLSAGLGREGTARKAHEGLGWTA